MSDNTNDRAYYLSLTPKERWLSLEYLIKPAYQIDEFPPMDRTVFIMRKHEVK
jgi:hypothetical protein